MEKTLLTVPELCVWLGCSRTTGYDLVSSGRIRAVRLTEGGAIRIPVEAVEEFMDSLDSVVPEWHNEGSPQPTAPAVAPPAEPTAETIGAASPGTRMSAP